VGIVSTHNDMKRKRGEEVKKEISKSIVAVIAGFAALAILSTIADSVLEKAGVMKTQPFVENPVWVIAIVILYRTIFNTLGCYLTARIAPNKPAQHAMILGILCVVLTIVGLIVMWDIPPRWYPISLIVLTLPAAWLGGKMAIGTRTNSISRGS
jgi:Kef-type K+ transport system membrane component KefB